MECLELAKDGIDTIALVESLDKLETICSVAGSKIPLLL